MAWAVAMIFVLAGMLMAWIPGLPGAAAAWCGVAVYAGWTDFATVSREALAATGLVALAATIAQWFAPASTVARWRGAAGVGTGAVAGGMLGLLSPLPLATWLAAMVGGLGGAVVGRGSIMERIKGSSGLVAAGCSAVWIDLAGVSLVLGMFGTAEFLARLAEFNS